MHAFHGGFWGMVEGVWGVSQKTLMSFTDLPKIQTLILLKSQKDVGTPHFQQE